jgi:hypothetical protein
MEARLAGLQEGKSLECMILSVVAPVFRGFSNLHKVVRNFRDTGTSKRLSPHNQLHVSLGTMRGIGHYLQSPP